MPSEKEIEQEIQEKGLNASRLNPEHIINAVEMNRLEYNKYRGWSLPNGENGADLGFKLSHESGRESWQPKEDFEQQYKDVTGEFDFGTAIYFIKKGYKVARKGWNGKSMWIVLSFGNEVESSKFWNHHNARFAKDNGGSAKVLDCITMKTADNTILIGWLPSQTDILSDDWGIVE